MPLPTDEEILALSNDIIQAFDSVFGLHPGFRPAHAKGKLLTGTFTPSPAAASFSRAPHFNRPSTPITVRFSDATGIPVIPDNDPNASPHGCAIRFHLAERVHTDIIAHSTDGFPVRTGQEFLEFLHAVAASSDPSKPHPWPVEVFVGSHPSTLAFVQSSKAAPSSFTRETFFGLTAMHFTNTDGAARYGRYRIVPEAGNEFLDDAALAAKSANYLFDDLEERIAKGPIKFRVLVQCANDGDIVDDVTIHWPEDRTVLDLGTIALTEFVNRAMRTSKKASSSIPFRGVDGIDPSEDPLLELRAAVYLISGRRRRAAPEQ